MNQIRFKLFSDEYRKALLAAVRSSPEDYEIQDFSQVTQFAERTASKMLEAIQSKGLGMVSIDGKGFKHACKALRIKHTRKAINDFLHSTEEE